MHVTVGKSLLGLKVFQHEGTFQVAQCALPPQQFAADHDSDESEELTLELCKRGEGGDDYADHDSGEGEELTLELCKCGEGGDAGDMAGIRAGRHVTKR